MNNKQIANAECVYLMMHKYEILVASEKYILVTLTILQGYPNRGQSSRVYKNANPWTTNISLILA